MGTIHTEEATQALINGICKMDPDLIEKALMIGANPNCTFKLTPKGMITFASNIHPGG